MNQFDDYDDDFDAMESEFTEAKRQALERSKEEFIRGCYDAYDLLATQGQEALNGASPKDIQRAINRMTQLFLLKEEYERCSFLKKYVDQHMPEFEITPDSSVVKELSL
jgi:hypothetical protein